MFAANLAIPAEICDDLLWGQAEYPRNLGQNGQNDLEGQGQWQTMSQFSTKLAIYDTHV